MTVRWHTVCVRALCVRRALPRYEVAPSIPPLRPGPSSSTPPDWLGRSSDSHHSTHQRFRNLASVHTTEEYSSPVDSVRICATRNTVETKLTKKLISPSYQMAAGFIEDRPLSKAACISRKCFSFHSMYTCQCCTVQNGVVVSVSVPFGVRLLGRGNY